MSDLTKMIVLPVDGSENAHRSLEYIDLMYGKDHNLEVKVCPPQSAANPCG
jgi:hypothetical protein